MKMKINLHAFSAAAGIVILAGAAVPVFAAELTGGVHVSAAGTNVSTTVKTEVKTDTRGKGHSDLVIRVKSKADEEILRRVNALNALIARVNDMKKLSDGEKSSLSTEIKSEIDAMTNLQAKITTDVDDNSTSSLREDVKSITASHRVFALVLPQGAIEAAADRLMTTVAYMQDLATKLQTRITASQSAGANMSAAVTAMADFNAKVADASTQSAAATAEVAVLMPDNGDQAKLQANETALKDARTKIVAAQKDLLTAREDAKTIIKVFASIKINATSTASTTDGHQ